VWDGDSPDNNFFATTSGFRAHRVG